MNSIAYMLDTDKSLQWLIDDHIILSYQGVLDGDIIDMMVQLADKMLVKLNTRTRIKKKVINVLIECLQNSFHYIEQFVEDGENRLLIESPFLMLAKQEAGFTIFTGNYIEISKAELLKERIDKICGLNDEELQDYYIKSLNKDELPQQGGAGLGLLDIVRRSKHNVVFDFKDINENYQVFTLLVNISLNQEKILASHEI